VTVAPLLLERLAENVSRRPDAPALVTPEGTTSYAELAVRAASTAEHLRRSGVSAGAIVGIHGRPSPSTLAAMIGVMSCGAAYLPADPSLPKLRLEAMLEDAAACVLLTDSALQVRCCPSRPLDPEPLTADPSDLRTDVGADLGAYVVYTSGSTGAPKGVAVAHGALGGFLSAVNERLCLDDSDVFLASTTISFDIAALELFLPLTLGGRVAFVPNAAPDDPDAFCWAAAAVRTTAMQGTPAFWRLLQLAAGLPPQLRVAIVGGETLPRDLAEWLRCAVGNAINAYGPCEATIWASTFDLSRGFDGVVPIGRPLANTVMYVLDRNGAPVPDGELGEIFIAGDGLAIGYVGRPELTAELFVANPFPGGGARMYATGDFGFRDAAGVFFFTGRGDGQVKIRGHRVEVEEVRNAVLGQPEIRDAVVVPVTAQGSGTELTAFIVPDPDLLRTRTVQVAKEQRRGWREVFDGLEDREPEQPDPQLLGWNSAVTHEAIPADEMHAWRDALVARILEFRPERVLEVGAGGGLVTAALAPHCREYVATDFALPAVSRLRSVLRREGLDHVETARLDAFELASLGESRFDCVVLNSVVQYFPDLNALTGVVAAAVSATRDGGLVLIGDVRDRRLLEAYHVWAHLLTTPGTSADEAAQVARRARYAESELTVDPAWFSSVAERLPRVAAIRHAPTQARLDNELGRFRYDAIVAVGPPTSLPSCAWLSWEPGLGSHIEELIASAHGPIGIRSIPNPRVSGIVELAERLTGRNEPPDALSSVLGQLSAAVEGIDPSDVAQLGRRCGCVAILDHTRGSGASYDVVFADVALSACAVRARIDFGSASDRPSRRPATEPAVRGALASLRSEIVPRVRRRLHKVLPQYMVPSGYVLVEELPRLVSGKIDRQTLDVLQAAGDRLSEPPRTEIERKLCRLWSDVLATEGIGRHDHFFETGGQSLAAAQLAARIRSTFRVEVDIRFVFDHPVLADLAAAIERTEVSGPQTPFRIPRATRVPYDEAKRAEESSGGAARRRR
jgi:amino acid adenylation domain-containing protein